MTRATQAWLLCLVQWDTGMQHHCCVVVYWMCCCVLDVLVRLLQLVVGKARATKHAMPGTLRGTPAQLQVVHWGEVHQEESTEEIHLLKH